MKDNKSLDDDKLLDNNELLDNDNMCRGREICETCKINDTYVSPLTISDDIDICGTCDSHTIIDRNEYKTEQDITNFDKTEKIEEIISKITKAGEAKGLQPLPAFIQKFSYLIDKKYIPFSVISLLTVTEITNLPFEILEKATTEEIDRIIKNIAIERIDKQIKYRIEKSEPQSWEEAERDIIIQKAFEEIKLWQNIINENAKKRKEKIND